MRSCEDSSLAEMGCLESGVNPWKEGIGAPTASLGWEGAGLPSKEREPGCPQSGVRLRHPRGEGARVPPKERERCAPRVGRGWGTPEERELGCPVERELGCPVEELGSTRTRGLGPQWSTPDPTGLRGEAVGTSRAALAGSLGEAAPWTGGG